MVGFPNKPMGFPTKNDHFWGVKWGYQTHRWRKHQCISIDSEKDHRPSPLIPPQALNLHPSLGFLWSFWLEVQCCRASPGDSNKPWPDLIPPTFVGFCHVWPAIDFGSRFTAKGAFAGLGGSRRDRPPLFLATRKEVLERGQKFFRLGRWFNSWPFHPLIGGHSTPG